MIKSMKMVSLMRGNHDHDRIDRLNEINRKTTRVVIRAHRSACDDNENGLHVYQYFPYSSSRGRYARTSVRTCCSSSGEKNYLEVNRNRSTELANKKDSLRAMCIDLNCGIDVSEREKSACDRLIKDVEEMYREDTEDFTLGVWRVIYSTAPPPSNGQIFGPIVGVAFQKILENNRYENVLELGDFITLRLKARFDVLSKVRWTATFETIQVELFNNSKAPLFVKAFPSGTTREWLTTYQDDEYRIVRAGKTEVELEKNVFVMVREKPWFET